MAFFLDSAETRQIKEAESWGFLQGVTTNPQLVFQAMRNQNLKNEDYYNYLEALAKTGKSKIFVQVLSQEEGEILAEAENLSAIFPDRLTLKIPFSPEGLKAINCLKRQGFSVASTAIFNPLQAQIAVEAGANLVIPFCHRLGKLAQDGVAVIGEIVKLFKIREIKAEILVASIKSQAEMLAVLALGVQHITVPYQLYLEIMQHPLTLEALEMFSSAQPGEE